MAFLGQRILTCSTRNLRSYGRFFSTSGHRFQEENIAVIDDTKADIMEGCPPKEYAIILQKEREIKRVDRKPFASELFLGNVVMDMLAFPEVLERAEVINLQRYTAKVKKLMKEANGESVLTRKDILGELKEMGLYGLTIPQQYGGIGASMTEYAAVAEELGMDSSLIAVLNSHLMLAAQQLIRFGSPEQKSEFLPKMASGEQIATFCFREPNIGSDLTQTKTLACHALDGYTYLLEGQKYWVPNGSRANLFFTLARGRSQSESEDALKTTISSYIVQRDDTVHVTPMENVSGLRESHYSTVNFNKTTIPELNQLGLVASGPGDTHLLFAYNRFGLAASVLGKLKHLRRMCIDHMVSTKRFGKYLSRYDSLLVQLGEMHQDIYMLESAVYFTAAIMDTSPINSYNVENALLMALCREVTFKNIAVARSIFGVDSLRDSHPCQQYLRDLQTLFYTETSDHLLKVYAALIGSIHFGNSNVDQIQKLRNPFFHPMVFIKHLVTLNKKFKSGYTHLDLAGHVHPTLITVADDLDRLVTKFECAVISVLKAYGRTMLNHQMDLIRMGEAAMYLYSLLACLSRSSRSYCIGLHNSSHEIEATNQLAMSLIEKVGKMIEELVDGKAFISDHFRMEHANKLLEIKDQFHEKAFQYND